MEALVKLTLLLRDEKVYPKNRYSERKKSVARQPSEFLDKRALDVP